MSFPNTVHGSFEKATETYTTARVPVGTRMEASDGRIYSFARIPSGTTLAPGSLYQSSLPGTDLSGMAIATGAVGDTTLAVTPGGTTVFIENELAGGFFHVDAPNVAANGSIAYRIKSHPAFTAPAAVTLTFEIGLVIAVAAADTGSVVKNPFAEVIIHPSPPTAALAGVALSTAVGAAISLSSTTGMFAWLQTRGVCSVLTEGTLVVGDECFASATTDGAVAPSAVDTEIPVGMVIRVEATTQFSPILLTLN